MTTAMKRQQLMAILTNANDDKISSFFDLWQDLTPTGDAQLTEQQVVVLEERRNEMLSGVAVTTDWETMHNKVRNKRLGR